MPRPQNTGWTRLGLFVLSITLCVIGGDIMVRNDNGYVALGLLVTLTGLAGVRWFSWLWSQSHERRRR